MKILIINEKLLEGGAEQSCLKMKKLLEEHKNDVQYLTFDDKFDIKIKDVTNSKNIINIKVNNNLINKMIFKPILYLKIRKVLKEVSPDKIILNNIFCSPITQLKALKGYEVYQIIRDYTVVCPKMTSVKMDYSICKGYNYEKCVKECVYHNSKVQLILKLNLVKRMEKLRKKIIKKVISPSENLNKYLIDYGYETCCINNPMDIKCQEIGEKKFNTGTKQYIYVGMINENKGIYRVLDVYKKFSQNKDVNLKILGKCTTKQDEEILYKYIEENNKITYLGYKNHDEVVKELKKADFLIVPSLWIENYPTTALEGMLYKCLVIGSNRGGIPEIIGNNRGYLFNILDEENVFEVLEQVYNINEKEYIDITQRAYNYVIKNNSYDEYYKKISEVIIK